MLDMIWIPLVSALIPLFTAAAVRPEGSNGWRSLLSLAMSGLVAAAAALVEGLTDWREILVAFGVAFVTQLTLYVGAYERIDINDRVLPTVGTTAGATDTFKGEAGC